MAAIPQMTPYGIYNIKYKASPKRAEATEQTLPATAYGKSYNPLSFLRAFQGLASEGILSQKDAYRKQIVDVMTSANSLSDVAEGFMDKDWPGLKFAGQAGIKGETMRGARPAEYDIMVTRLAQPHAYGSETVPSGSRDILEPGTYDLEITTQIGREKAIFDVRPKDTARFTLARIADAVNSFSQSVTAKITEENGLEQLQLVARENGKNGSFSLSSSSDWLDHLKIGLLQSGQDGEAIVDGKAYATKDNKLELDEGRLKVSFTQAGSGRIGVVPDQEGAILSLELLVKAYNNFNETMQSASNKTDKGGRLLGAATSLFEGSNGKELAAVGLHMNEDGRLSLDEGKAGQAAGEDIFKVRDILGKGAAFAFYNMANSVQRSPVSYYFAPSGGEAVSLNNTPDKWQGIFVDIAA